MARKDLKGALGASLKAEDKAVQDRFAKAEALLGGEEAQNSVGGRQKAEGNGQRAERVERLDRVLRDSFTMPAHDYDQIGALKDRCLKQGIGITKSEILRAGLIALQEMPDTELRATVAKLVKVKTGRPSDSSQ